MHGITTRWNWNRWVAAGATAYIGALGWSDIARADAVTDWHEIAANTLCSGLATPPRSGPTGLLDLAMVQIAVHDAVQSIGGKYKPYHTQVSGASGSPEAATAKAAHDVLVAFYAPKAEELGKTYKEYLAKKGLKEDDPGVAVGQKTAAAIIALRADDGRIPNPAFTGEEKVGMWRPTEPHKEMAGATLGAVKPFVIQSGSQFRPGPPPDLKSEQYATAYNEVKALGARTNSTRTPEQTELAKFYRSEHLCLIFQRTPRDAAIANVKSIDESARLMALVNIAMADAIITVWDSKRHFNFWRPLTAIREGENDGNPATAGDPSWMPFVDSGPHTPPYPDYTSGANGGTGAYTRMLANFFGKDDMTFTVTTTAPDVAQKTRTYNKFSDMATDMVNVRIYHGVHFRFADVAARDQGEKVADEVFKSVATPK